MNIKKPRSAHSTSGRINAVPPDFRRISFAHNALTQHTSGSNRKNRSSRLSPWLPSRKATKGLSPAALSLCGARRYSSTGAVQQLQGYSTIYYNALSRFFCHKQERIRFKLRLSIKNVTRGGAYSRLSYAFPSCAFCFLPPRFSR